MIPSITCTEIVLTKPCLCTVKPVTIPLFEFFFHTIRVILGLVMVKGGCFRLGCGDPPYV